MYGNAAKVYSEMSKMAMLVRKNEKRCSRHRNQMLANFPLRFFRFDAAPSASASSTLSGSRSPSVSGRLTRASRPATRAAPPMIRSGRGSHVSLRNAT